MRRLVAGRPFLEVVFFSFFFKRIFFIFLNIFFCLFEDFFQFSFEGRNPQPLFFCLFCNGFSYVFLVFFKNVQKGF